MKGTGEGWGPGGVGTPGSGSRGRDQPQAATGTAGSLCPTGPLCVPLGKVSFHKRVWSTQGLLSIGASCLFFWYLAPGRQIPIPNQLFTLFYP